MKTYFLLVMTVGLLMACAVNGQAQQPNPPGSYLKSCNPVKAEGGKLTAVCASGNPYTILGGEAFVGASTIESFFECEGDISNNKGTLVCNRNPNSFKLKNAKAAIKYGMTQVLGIPPAGDTETYYWLGRMFSEGGLQPKYFQHQGLHSKDAEDFFQKHLAAPKSGNVRKAVINQAFNDVYGWPAKPSDLAFWDTAFQKGGNGYYMVLLVERPKLGTDKVIRRLVINNAYLKAFGRAASKGNFDYWMPRSETYKELVAAQRTWLYSANGQTDLNEMVSRAVQSKNGTTNVTLILQATQKAKAGKLIYAEM